MRRSRLSAADMVVWAALGAGAGLIAGFVAGEWLGGVNQARLRRAAGRLQTPRPRAVRPAALARAAEEALAAQAELRELDLEAATVAEGVVELRGWVPNRTARTLAARTVRAVDGVDTVINNILVRGEDDRTLRRPPHRSADQSA